MSLGFSDDEVIFGVIFEKTENELHTSEERAERAPRAVTVVIRSVGNMQLSANTEEKNDSCSVPEHEFQDDTRSRKLCMLMIIMFTVVCVLSSIIVVIYTIKIDHCHNDTVPAIRSGYKKSEGGSRIIRRREWLASPPIHPADPLHHPVPYIIVLHTGTENCITREECVYMVRQIQTFHMESNGWWDIGYSFLVGGDGLVYEARGWDSTGAFAYGYNNKSIGIAFIGSFHTQLPTPAQMSAAKSLIEHGVETGRVAQDYKLLGHRQVSGTRSPGDRFFEELQTWPHWAETP